MCACEGIIIDFSQLLEIILHSTLSAFTAQELKQFKTAKKLKVHTLPYKQKKPRTLPSKRKESLSLALKWKEVQLRTDNISNKMSKTHGISISLTAVHFCRYKFIVPMNPFFN